MFHYERSDKNTSDKIKCAYPDYNKQPKCGWLNYNRLYELARELRLLSIKKKREVADA